MSVKTHGSALEALAAAAGVATAYRDGLGADRRVRPGTLVAVLRCLGIGLESARDAAGALRRLRAARRERVCEPVTIAWQGRKAAVSVRGAGVASRPLECTLALEGGGTRRWRARVGASGGRVELPAGMPTGAHQLTILGRGLEAETVVLAAPRRCHVRPGKRELGIFIPVHALRSGEQWGVGDLGDLRRLLEWARRAGCGFVGTLPLLACSLDRPFDPSPYSPVSRLFWNELFLDVPALPEFKACAAAVGLAARGAGEAESLRRSRLVDYRRAYRLKRGVLEVVARHAMSRAGSRAAILRFGRANPLAREYAAFRATSEAEGPGGGRRAPDADRLEARGERAYCTHLFAQFALDRQLGAMRADGTGLYLDLPVGARGDGFDTWRFPGAFARGLSVGAPPDALFVNGQNWGFPPLHPEGSRRDGHAYFRACVRALMVRSTVIRIDHVLGLHRLFCIPDGEHEGTYVAQPAEELYAALAIESHRARVEVVGENLGTIPPGVEDALARHGVLGMRVGEFEMGDRRRPIPTAHARSLACLNTHDMPTFAGYWHGDDVDLRLRLGLLRRTGAARERRERARMRRVVERALAARGALGAGTGPEGVLRALLEDCAAGPAAKALVNLEDLWGERRPHNVPGVTRGTPNWRRKAARTVESIIADEDLAATLRALSALRRTVRRGGKKKGGRS